MTVNFKSELSSNNTNTAYVSKSADDIKTGKMGLNKPAEGSEVISVQKSLNEIFDTQGTTEGDVNAKVYANENNIANGDNQKTAIEKLDVAVQDNADGVQGIIDSKGVANGFASLDNNAKIPAAQLPFTFINYIGLWDADTNTPTLINSTQATFDAAISGVTGNVQLSADFFGTKGNDIVLTGDGVKDLNTLVSDWNTANPDNLVSLDSANGADIPDNLELMELSGAVDNANNSDAYHVSVAGSHNFGQGSLVFQIGDKVVFNSFLGQWEKWDTIDQVTSVAGKVGAVTLDKTDVGLSNVTDDAQLKRAAGDFATFTEKAVPVDADIVLIEDSEDSNNKKKVQLANLLGGGGSGGSFIWDDNSDNAPISNWENGITLFEFDFESEQELYALITVPESYTAGDQIFLKGGKFYSSDNQDNVLFRCETQLIFTGTNMASLPLTGHVSANTEKTLTVANSLTEIGDIDLCDVSGQIDGFDVNPQDILLIRFYRDNTNETSSSSEDAKFIKFSAGVAFA